MILLIIYITNLKALAEIFVSAFYSVYKHGMNGEIESGKDGKGNEGKRIKNSNKI